MKEFMMIFRNEKSDDGSMPSEAQMQTVLAEWQSWIKAIAAKGKFSGTNRLYPEGKTLKPGNVIMDGPYAEVKEMIGGYLIVNAASLDEAVEMARSCPGLVYGGNVEVRTVMPINSDSGSATFLQPQ
ncbi:MAG: YciI family protein [Ferruginibacter sp.]